MSIKDDPLSNAKISTPEPPRRGRPPLDKGEAQEGLRPTLSIAEVPEETPVFVPKRFRVLTTRSISWFGYVTTISEGAIVDESTYTIAGIESLRNQGIKLEEIK